MRFLLDTSAFLKWVNGTIPNKVRLRIQRPNVKLLVSIITPWEIALKSNPLRKSAVKGIQMPSVGQVKQAIDLLGAQLLPLTLEHAEWLYTLPLHHQHPFDRIIIAQALEENCVVVTSDQQFSLYDGLQVLWD